MICKKANVGIGAMKRIKAFVSLHLLENVYKSLEQPARSSDVWEEMAEDRASWRSLVSSGVAAFEKRRRE